MVPGVSGSGIENQVHGSGWQKRGRNVSRGSELLGVLQEMNRAARRERPANFQEFLCRIFAGQRAAPGTWRAQGPPLRSVQKAARSARPVGVAGLAFGRAGSRRAALQEQHFSGGSLRGFRRFATAQMILVWRFKA